MMDNQRPRRRWFPPPLSSPWALVIGAAIIAAALLATPLIAPYRFQAAMLGGFWRFNAVTGEAVICLSEDNIFDLTCSWPYRPKARPARETK